MSSILILKELKILQVFMFLCKVLKILTFFYKILKILCKILKISYFFIIILKNLKNLMVPLKILYKILKIPRFIYMILNTLKFSVCSHWPLLGRFYWSTSSPEVITNLPEPIFPNSYLKMGIRASGTSGKWDSSK